MPSCATQPNLLHAKTAVVNATAGSGHCRIDIAYGRPSQVINGIYYKRVVTALQTVTVNGLSVGTWTLYVCAVDVYGMRACATEEVTVTLGDVGDLSSYLASQASDLASALASGACRAVSGGVSQLKAKCKSVLSATVER